MPYRMWTLGAAGASSVPGLTVRGPVFYFLKIQERRGWYARPIEKNS